VWVEGRMPGSRDATPGPLPADDAPVRVCVYRVPAGEQGGGKPAGDFQSGGELSADRWAAIKRELATAGPAGACRTPADRFAVLHLPAGLIYVEADGCRRVLIEGISGPGTLLQGTAKLASLTFDR